VRVGQCPRCRTSHALRSASVFLTGSVCGVRSHRSTAAVRVPVPRRENHSRLGRACPPLGRSPGGRRGAGRLSARRRSPHALRDAAQRVDVFDGDDCCEFGRASALSAVQCSETDLAGAVIRSAECEHAAIGRFSGEPLLSPGMPALVFAGSNAPHCTHPTRGLERQHRSARSRWRMPAFWRPNFMNRRAVQPLFEWAGNRPFADVVMPKRRTT